MWHHHSVKTKCMIHVNCSSKVVHAAVVVEHMKVCILPRKEIEENLRLHMLQLSECMCNNGDVP